MLFRCLKRIGVFLLAIVVLTVVVFVSSKPKEVKAVAPIAIGISAIASFFSAAGITLATQNMTSNNYASAIQNYADEYSSSSGTPTIEDYVNTKDAINYYYNEKAGEAVVSVSNDFSEWLNSFKNWFVQKFALTDSGETVVIADSKFTTYDGKSYSYYTDFSSFTDGKVPASSVSVSLSPEVIQLNQNYYLVVQGYDDGFMYGYYRPGVRFILYDALGNVVGTNGHRYASSTQNNFSFIRVCFQWFPQYGYFGINSLPLDNGKYNSGGYSYHLPMLTMNEVTTSQIGMTGSLTDGYSDFEQALTGAQTDAGENGQIAIGTGEVEVDKPYTKENVAEAILNNTIANTGEGVLVGGYADDKEVEEENDVSKVPTAAEIGSNIIVIDGLHRFFPFCIPWDIYDLIEKFNVEPEAPVFDLNIGFAGLYQQQTVHLDFSSFDTAALIFRVLIVIAFGFFLIIKTRDLIRG